MNVLALAGVVHPWARGVVVDKHTLEPLFVGQIDFALAVFDVVEELTYGYEYNLP